MTRPAPRFALGERVQFSDTVQKARDENRRVTWESAGLPQRESYRMDEDRKWERHIRKFTEGVIVGQRALAEYYVATETDYGEYGVSYGSYTTSQQVPGTSKRAWLVSYDLHRRPVLVLDEHVEKILEDEDG